MKITKLVRRNFFIPRNFSAGGNVGGKQLINFLMFCAIILSAAQLILIQNIEKANAETLWESQTGVGGSDSEIGEVFGQRTGDPEDIRIIAARVVKVFLGIIGITLVVLLVLAGYKWMTAAGNEEKVTEAKKQISRAAIGLLIILTAWSIAEFVTGCLTDITSNSMFSNFCP